MHDADMASPITTLKKMVHWTLLMRVRALNNFMKARDVKRAEVQRMTKDLNKVKLKEMRLFKPRKYKARPNY